VTEAQVLYQPLIAPDVPVWKQPPSLVFISAPVVQVLYQTQKYVAVPSCCPGPAHTVTHPPTGHII
jgi:hypothetical protein